MEYTDKTRLTNEDLVACYPRRIGMGQDYELWQFPYVKNEILYDEDDIIAINFGKKTNRISIISEYPAHFDDLDYINRVISLVHDVSDSFQVNHYLINNDSGLSLEEVMQKLKIQIEN